VVFSRNSIEDHNYLYFALVYFIGYEYPLHSQQSLMTVSSLAFIQIQTQLEKENVTNNHKITIILMLVF